MGKKYSSPFLIGLENYVFLLILFIAVIDCGDGAPIEESTELQQITDGCYYNYNHYNEGDRILTNEPCLNCTCHDKMLMCYLRVCPFTKPIGQDCVIEKREDQCCPIITCPEVPVNVMEHKGQGASTDLGFLEKYGCNIDGNFFPEGAQVPSNPNKPCELCYCINNRTSCIMQECTLHIDGCQPIYHRGSCCPVRYNCDHEEELTEDLSTTTIKPTEGFILTTTSDITKECVHHGNVYFDGASIESDKKCEHCYCMKGDIVCAVQECSMPIEFENRNCTSVKTNKNDCCPQSYACLDEMDFVSKPEITTKSTDVEETTLTHPEISEEDLQLQEHIHDLGEMPLDKHVPSSKVDETPSPAEVSEEPATQATFEKSSTEQGMIFDIKDMIPLSIPGEGSCLVEDLTYKNNSLVPSNDKCEYDCICISSVVKCESIICEKPATVNCKINESTKDVCCPTYECGEEKISIGQKEADSTTYSPDMKIGTQLPPEREMEKATLQPESHVKSEPTEQPIKDYTTIPTQKIQPTGYTIYEKPSIDSDFLTSKPPVMIHTTLTPEHRQPLDQTESELLTRGDFTEKYNTESSDEAKPQIPSEEKTDKPDIEMETLKPSLQDKEVELITSSTVKTDLISETDISKIDTTQKPEISIEPDIKLPELSKEEDTTTIGTEVDVTTPVIPTEEKKEHLQTEKPLEPITHEVQTSSEELITKQPITEEILKGETMIEKETEKAVLQTEISTEQTDRKEPSEVRKPEIQTDQSTVKEGFTSETVTKLPTEQYTEKPESFIKTDTDATQLSEDKSSEKPDASDEQQKPAKGDTAVENAEVEEQTMKSEEATTEQVEKEEKFTETGIQKQKTPEEEMLETKTEKSQEIPTTEPAQLGDKSTEDGIKKPKTPEEEMLEIKTEKPQDIVTTEPAQLGDKSTEGGIKKPKTPEEEMLGTKTEKPEDIASTEPQESEDESTESGIKKSKTPEEEMLDIATTEPAQLGDKSTESGIKKPKTPEEEVLDIATTEPAQLEDKSTESGIKKSKTPEAEMLDTKTEKPQDIATTEPAELEDKSTESGIKKPKTPEEDMLETKTEKPQDIATTEPQESGDKSTESGIKTSKTPEEEDIATKEPAQLGDKSTEDGIKKPKTPEEEMLEIKTEKPQDIATTEPAQLGDKPTEDGIKKPKTPEEEMLEIKTEKPQDIATTEPAQLGDKSTESGIKKPKVPEEEMLETKTEKPQDIATTEPAQLGDKPTEGEIKKPKTPEEEMIETETKKLQDIATREPVELGDESTESGIQKSDIKTEKPKVPTEQLTERESESENATEEPATDVIESIEHKTEKDIAEIAKPTESPKIDTSTQQTSEQPARQEIDLEIDMPKKEPSTDFPVTESESTKEEVPTKPEEESSKPKEEETTQFMNEMEIEKIKDEKLEIPSTPIPSSDGPKGSELSTEGLTEEPSASVITQKPEQQTPIEMDIKISSLPTEDVTEKSQKGDKGGQTTDKSGQIPDYESSTVLPGKPQSDSLGRKELDTLKPIVKSEEEFTTESELVLQSQTEEPKDSITESHSTKPDSQVEQEKDIETTTDEVKAEHDIDEEKPYTEKPDRTDQSTEKPEEKEIKKIEQPGKDKKEFEVTEKPVTMEEEKDQHSEGPESKYSTEKTDIEYQTEISTEKSTDGVESTAPVEEGTQKPTKEKDQQPHELGVETPTEGQEITEKSQTEEVTLQVELADKKPTEGQESEEPIRNITKMPSLPTELEQQTKQPIIKLEDQKNTTEDISTISVLSTDKQTEEPEHAKKDIFKTEIKDLTTNIPDVESSDNTEKQQLSTEKTPDLLVDKERPEDNTEREEHTEAYEEETSKKTGTDKPKPTGEEYPQTTEIELPIQNYTKQPITVSTEQTELSNATIEEKLGDEKQKDEDYKPTLSGEEITEKPEEIIPSDAEKLKPTTQTSEEDISKTESPLEMITEILKDVMPGETKKPILPTEEITDTPKDIEKMEEKTEKSEPSIKDVTDKLDEHEEITEKSEEAVTEKSEEQIPKLPTTILEEPVPMAAITERPISSGEDLTNKSEKPVEFETKKPESVSDSPLTEGETNLTTEKSEEKPSDVIKTEVIPKTDQTAKPELDRSTTKPEIVDQTEIEITEPKVSEPYTTQKPKKDVDLTEEKTEIPDDLSERGDFTDQPEEGGLPEHKPDISTQKIEPQSEKSTDVETSSAPSKYHITEQGTEISSDDVTAPTIDEKPSVAIVKPLEAITPTKDILDKEEISTSTDKSVTRDSVITQKDDDSTTSKTPYATRPTEMPPLPYQPPGFPSQYPSYTDDYSEEEEPEIFGPGTCRYGGKLFVSAQQIPRDDPCDFCFCFRSDIICLQQSCPPPISGCNEEPIQGFCCPRYECPVSMATSFNSTTTTTTLPPHFLHRRHPNVVERNGCLIQGQPFKVGDRIPSASGPCMQCKCGGDGQMKCDPKPCTPEPMLRQMIAAVASRRR